MSDPDPISLRVILGGQSKSGKKTPEPVCFQRQELSHILNLYGHYVAAGEWKDYAIDILNDKAVFSIFRRTTEVPLYRIEKTPKLRKKQGQYSVMTATGQILKRGHDLTSVLRVLEKRTHYEDKISYLHI